MIIIHLINILKTIMNIGKIQLNNITLILHIIIIDINHLTLNHNQQMN
ncbi:hypothetical protein XBO1_2270026 [Xenorhabdus bovienii str. oregonense]|uniref:Uncharacterized protein n=1 Tax=Xenorhabdus bovienii str. oregonense TaxID=1398202 RepID=A0A077P5Q2_XENBV|nr:hypothetical protein XBO1_2270026 [Xenorhabdus bovienii str. oregonense]